MRKMPNSHMYKSIKLINLQIIVKSYTHDRKKIKQDFQEDRLRELDTNLFCRVVKVIRVYCSGGIDNCENVWGFFVYGLGSEIFDHLARRNIFLSYGSSYRMNVHVWYAVSKANPDGVRFDVDRITKFEPVMDEIPALNRYGVTAVPEVTWGKEDEQE